MTISEFRRLSTRFLLDPNRLGTYKMRSDHGKRLTISDNIVGHPPKKQIVHLFQKKS